MTFDEITLYLSKVNWDLALGLSVVPLFLFLAIIYLIKGEWPWEKKYRSMSLAGIFLLFGVWSSAGISGIAGAFWTFFFLGGLGFLAWKGRDRWHDWVGNLPVPGQTFQLRGVGEVEIKQVYDGLIPWTSSVLYLGPDGLDTSIYTRTLLHQGTLLEDREQNVGLDALGM